MATNSPEERIMIPDKKQNKGFACPECTFLIQPTIRDLLYELTIQCPQCGLKLHMDKQASNAALQALQELHVAVENISVLNNTQEKR